MPNWTKTNNRLVAQLSQGEVAIGDFSPVKSYYKFSAFNFTTNQSLPMQILPDPSFALNESDYLSSHWNPEEHSDTARIEMLGRGNVLYVYH